MRIGDTLKKAAGLFVEFDENQKEDELSFENPVSPRPTPTLTSSPTPTAVPAPAPAPKTVEQIVRETPGPNLDEIKVPATPAPQVVGPDGSVDFRAIYQLATLPEAPFTAEKVLEVLATLPQELPLETRRATVKVTLSAMGASLGVTPETIVTDASRKLAALAAYAQSYVHQADEYVQRCEAEIAQLEAEITRRRQAIGEAKTKQAKVNEACHAESDRLDDVLEFFSMDVPPSKYAGG